MERCDSDDEAAMAGYRCDVCCGAVGKKKASEHVCVLEIKKRATVTITIDPPFGPARGFAHTQGHGLFSHTILLIKSGTKTKVARAACRYGANTPGPFGRSELAALFSPMVECHHCPLAYGFAIALEVF
jgi:hypothetical protein